MALKISERAKRAVACPTCGVAKFKPCKSSRIPGANTFGGGWGGLPDLERAHPERRALAIANQQAQAEKADAEWRAKQEAQDILTSYFEAIEDQQPHGPWDTLQHFLVCADKLEETSAAGVVLACDIRSGIVRQCATQIIGEGA